MCGRVTARLQTNIGLMMRRDWWCKEIGEVVKGGKDENGKITRGASDRARWNRKSRGNRQVHSGSRCCKPFDGIHRIPWQRSARKIESPSHSQVTALPSNDVIKGNVMDAIDRSVPKFHNKQQQTITV